MHLVIESSQKVGDVKEHFHSEAEAKMKILNETLCLSYEETMEGVERPIMSLIKWNAEDHSVSMTRKGDVRTHMQFEEGKTTPCDYISAFGALKLDIRTHLIRSIWDGQEGQIDLRYDILCGGEITSENELHLRFTE